MGMKERMRSRDRQLQQEQDTDDEGTDPPAANTRSKTRRKRIDGGGPSGVPKRSRQG